MGKERVLDHSDNHLGDFEKASPLIMKMEKAVLAIEITVANLAGVWGLGTFVSLCSNPFGAKAGFMAGTCEHIFVGLTSTIDAAAYAAVTGSIAVYAGLAVGNGYTIQRSEDVRDAIVDGVIVGALCAGMVGAWSGYNAASSSLLEYNRILSPKVSVGKNQASDSRSVRPMPRMSVTFDAPIVRA
jgi:hypothetical protein